MRAPSLLLLLATRAAAVKFSFRVAEWPGRQEREHKSVLGYSASQPVVAQEQQQNRPTRKLCLDKVEMVEQTEYDEVVHCDHSYKNQCHSTFVTKYDPHQEEVCKESFIKNCFINYEKIAFNETVEVCRNPLVKDCTTKGNEMCRTVYESECWTRQEKVPRCGTRTERRCEDDLAGQSVVCRECGRPVTKCSRQPRRLCAPPGCGLKQVRLPRRCINRGQAQQTFS